MLAIAVLSVLVERQTVQEEDNAKRKKTVTSVNTTIITYSMMQTRTLLRKLKHSQRTKRLYASHCSSKHPRIE